MKILHTQSELKKLIEDKDKELQEVLYGYKDSDEYKEIEDELSELRKKVSRLERRKTEISVEHKEKHQSEIELIKDDRVHLQGLLNKLKMGEDPKEHSEEIQRMFNSFCSGTDGSRYKKLQWVSDDGKYALFKRNSYSSYGGRMSGSGGVGAVWALVKVVEDNFKYELSYFRGVIDERNQHFVIWAAEGGRWNKKRQEEMELALFKHINGIEE